jgi:3-deoxy-D-manno-octulosonic-acid transferase
VRYFLNLAYLALLVAISPYLLYAAVRHGKYLQGWPAKFWGAVPVRDGVQPCIWFHAVSVGEMKMLAGLISRAKAARPDLEVVISTTTRAAYAMARLNYSAQRLFYCPLDFSWAVRRALQRIRPDLLVLVELELWPNLLAAAQRGGVPVAIVNGRISDRSFRRYAKIRWFTRRWLSLVAWLGVQSAEDADRFEKLGADPRRVKLTGSLKFDGVQTDRHNSGTMELARLAGIDGDDLVFLAGSTQDPEEQMALRVYAQLVTVHPELRLILVPRHPERFDAVAAQVAQSGLRCARRSQWQNRADTPAASRQRWQVLLVDTVGELGAWWGTADVAFVGGSLGRRGGQNMLEPAAYGAAVAFGPNTRNFRDITRLLLAAQGAVVVTSEEELRAFVAHCLEDEPYRRELGANAQRLVLANRGAADRTTAALLDLLPHPPENTRRGAVQLPRCSGGRLVVDLRD